MEYIYIEKSKVYFRKKIINEEFDKKKIEISKKIINNIYHFDFDERGIKIVKAPSTMALYFTWEDQEYTLYLGYHPNSKLYGAIKRKQCLYLNLHYICDFDIRDSDNSLYYHEMDSKEINVIEANFSFWDGKNYFNGTFFKRDVEFYGAHFLGGVMFYKCVFEGNAYFRYTKFLKMGSFEYAQFEQIAVFEGVVFNKMNFVGAFIASHFLMRDIITTSNSMIDISDIGGNFLLEIEFSKELISAINNYRCENKYDRYNYISKEFLILNKAYRIQSFYEEEDKSYFLFRKYQKNSHHFGIKKFGENILYLFGGFGTKLGWNVLGMGFTILFFLIVIIFVQSISSFSEINIVDVLEKIKSAFIVSLQTFLSLEFVEIETHVKEILFPILSLEAILGNLQIIYFSICFSRKAIR